MSYAVPAVAGAVANLKDHLYGLLDSSFVNDVGNLYATMLLMGNQALESGTYGATTPPDDLWGVGAMKMRLFTEGGMDAPWRVRWCVRVLSDGETKTCDLNPNPEGVNQSIPSDVEWFKTAAWWYEPNLDDGQTPADIGFKVCKSTGSPCYTASGSEPQVKRLWLGSAVSGYAWQLSVMGTDIPASEDSWYHSEEQKRVVHIALYWEDRDRDDSDGPASTIE